MEKKKGVYRTLFSAAFKLSAGTFGGGFVIVPLMREKFVRQLHWIEEQEMMDLIAIAESAPGAIAVNASILVGYHVAGCLGALLAVLGTVLPPLLIISAVSCCYSAVRDNVLVSLVMTGMLSGVAAVICDVVITLGARVIKAGRPVLWLLMGLAFVAVQIWKVNIVPVMLLCGAVGAADTALGRREAVRPA